MGGDSMLDGETAVQLVQTLLAWKGIEEDREAECARPDSEEDVPNQSRTIGGLEAAFFLCNSIHANSMIIRDLLEAGIEC
jgi:hypothetical protein